MVVAPRCHDMMAMLPYHDSVHSWFAGYDAVDRALLKASFVMATLSFYLRKERA